MSEAAPKRRMKAIKVDDRLGKPKAQMLKFDCRAGLVLMEKSESTREPKPFVALVRNLLAWLRLIPPASEAKRHTKGIRSR